jgi:hypothetical protein
MANGVGCTPAFLARVVLCKFQREVFTAVSYLPQFFMRKTSGRKPTAIREDKLELELASEVLERVLQLSGDR